ncbi:motile sperm domain-containing protein 2-like protein [Dinothrombium tinctorium]|uniref:Motile sperm domain-containing protein 2-like protein n=1 Tax=Dinothrombium tinctorium TaxID=1965070 RepID=A0A3S3S4U3_9ACAR|nr:motile sperm domain-containing protein 2-like protein [Dinothrombium tinctorium]RWS09145.1 motile sperm domain-containing protein 2-like protein [Dinothrombium tinctorium]
MPEENVEIEPKEEAISFIRKRILDEFNENKEIFDEIDVENVRDNDWSVERFLLHCKNNREEAFEMLKESLKWRKSFEVNRLKAEDFPREFYKSGSFFPLAEDKEGNLMIYLRGKLHRKLPDWTELFKKFFVFIIDTVDKKMGGKRYAVFWDCEGAGLQNVDFDMLSFMTKVVSSYFPYGLEYVLLHELPWVLHTIYNLARSWVPEHYQRLARFANRSQITDWIDIKNLPDYLNGECQIDYRKPPEGAPSAKEAQVKYNLNSNAASRLEAHLNQYCYNS